MNPDAIVFLGPTLRADEARALFPATILPPASQGDVYEACNRFSPKIVAIIDGVYDAVPAVRHKEILWAISAGVRVYGASSMGALRAAELSEFGMIGFGLIYRWYRTTPMIDDDEVAVSTGPRELGWRALSDALVDIRLSLRKAARAGIISWARCRALEAKASAMYFPERSYKALLAGDEDPAAARLTTWLKEHATSQKAEDARGLLKGLRAENARFLRQSSRRTCTIEPQLTLAWTRDLLKAGLRPPFVSRTTTRVTP